MYYIAMGTESLITFVVSNNSESSSAVTLSTHSCQTTTYPVMFKIPNTTYKLTTYHILTVHHAGTCVSLL